MASGWRIFFVEIDDAECPPFTNKTYWNLGPEKMSLVQNKLIFQNCWLMFLNSCWGTSWQLVGTVSFNEHQYDSAPPTNGVCIACSSASLGG